MVRYDCGCIILDDEGDDRRCRDHKNLLDEDVEEENERKNILLQHIADNTRLATAGKLRHDINYHIFFMPNPRGRRILHISFCESLSQNEKQVINNKFPGLVMAH